MPRYVVFLRGVSPQNLRMSDLKACLTQAGFQNVRTVLSSGNAAFDCDIKSLPEVERTVQAAMQQHLNKSFHTIGRSASSLADLLATSPYAGYELPQNAKRVISFLRETRKPKVPLPLTEGTATVIRQLGSEVFTAYIPGPEGPVFMKLIERAYGSDVTTRTWETVSKCATA